MQTRLTRWALGLAWAAGTVGLGMGLAGIHSAARAVLVLVFVAVVPTGAIAGLLRTLDGLARLVIACTANIALLTLTAIVMLDEGVWSPTGGLLVVATISAACLTMQLPPVRQRLTATGASWRKAAQTRLALTDGHVVPARNGRDRFLSGTGVESHSSAIYEDHPNGDVHEVPSLSSTTEVVGWTPVRRKDRSVGSVDNAGNVTEERENAASGRARSSSWSPVTPSSLGQIFRGEAEPTDPSVFIRDDGVALLYPRRVNLFMGEPDSCKTWACLLAVAQEIRKGNVACVVDFEDSPETTVGRLRQLGLTEAQITDGLVYCSPDSPFDPVAKTHLEKHFQHLCNSSNRNLTLAVVDSVSEAMSVEGLDPALGGDVMRFCHRLPRWLKDRGAAVVLTEHTINSTGSQGQSANGGERMINGVDGAAYSFKEISPFGRGVTGKIKVAVSKDRGGFVRQHAVGKVMGTLIFTSSPQDGSVSASFAPPTGSRQASRRSQSKTPA